jgi:hypothetical protein
MIDPFRFCICHVERSRDISNARVFENTRFFHFGWNDKMVIRRSSENGGQNALKRNPAAGFAAA